MRCLTEDDGGTEDQARGIAAPPRPGGPLNVRSSVDGPWLKPCRGGAYGGSRRIRRIRAVSAHEPGASGRSVATGRAIVRPWSVLRVAAVLGAAVVLIVDLLVVVK